MHTLMTKKILTVGLLSLLTLTLAGCGEQEKVSIKSVEVISKEDGNPDFRRIVKICFDKPLDGAYHHEILLESKDGFKLEGHGLLRAAANDEDNPCILRNMNQYVNKKSPPRARDLIERYLDKGNVASVKVTVWGDNSGEKGAQMDTKIFSNL
jgi:hypothetical protein